MLKRLFPILEWLPNYKMSYLSGDITAGITVGIMLIPQGMAYAMIAGLPPVFGLYAALIPQIIYALMGTSRQLAVGPVAMDSLLVASALGALALSGIEEYISMALFLALFMGTIQFILGLFRMGFLVNYLSKPVISGFTSAAAIIIGLSQLKHLLGTEIASTSHIHELIQDTIRSLENISLTTLSIGVIAIALIIVLKKIHKQIPGGLIAVFLGIAAVYLFNLEATNVKIVGSIPQGLPNLSVPNFDWSRVSDLFPIAMTLALIAFMEAISVAKAVEERHDTYEVNANQELIALGSSNIIGSFFNSYPTTGGFSRTAVNDQAGANTGLASIFSAGIVGLTLLFLTPLFYYLPNAILAAVVMVAVFGLIDLKYPKELFIYRKDEFYLLIFTFIITLFIGIKEGILLGVLVSLLLLVYRTSKPHIAVLGKIAGTDYFRNIHRFKNEAEIDDDLLILRFDAQIYFGNKDYFKQAILKEIKAKGPGLKWLILNAEAINYIDSSASYMLKQFIEELKENGVTFIFAGATGPTRDILFKSRLVDIIGENNLYVSTLEAYKSIKTDDVVKPEHKQISLQTKI